MDTVYALLLTLAVGLFMLMGTGIVFLTKNNRRTLKFSIGMAFGVMSTLALFELIPESYELLRESLSQIHTIYVLLGAIVFGIIGLKLLDRFIPDHEIEHDTKKDIEENLLHIGMVSSIALLLHNMIEGMAIYSSVISSLQLGLLVCIGVGLHNIPMGMVITSTIYSSNQSMKKTLLISFVLSISTFFGGILIYLFRDSITVLAQGVLLAITLGMILYIVLFELLPHILHEKDKKLTLWGIILGVSILLISLQF